MTVLYKNSLELSPGA